MRETFRGFSTSCCVGESIIAQARLGQDDKADFLVMMDVRVNILFSLRLSLIMTNQSFFFFLKRYY
jgi:hypothetical protein